MTINLSLLYGMSNLPLAFDSPPTSLDLAMVHHGLTLKGAF